MTRLFGRAHLSPEGDGGGASETVTAGEAKELTVSELADMKVTLEDGTVVSGKEFTESRRKQPDVEKRLAEEREKLESEHKSRMDELSKREAELTAQMDAAGKGKLNEIAELLQQAAGGKAKSPTNMTKDEVKAYVTNALRNEGGDVALNTVLDMLYSDRDATAEEIKKLRKEFATLKDENERERTNERVRQNADRIVREIQALHEKDPDFPLFDPKGRDEFSLLVGELLRYEEKSDILDGKIGADTPPAEVARLVNAYLDKRADDRVTKREAAKKKAEASEAAQPSGSGSGRKVPDELEKELEAARKISDPTERREAIFAVHRKIAASG